MVQPICRDPILLGQPCRPATRQDLPIARDLLETLMANRQVCVGMAANMIGQPVRIIAFEDGEVCRVMLNPEILSRQEPFDTQEGCASLTGQRPVTRYRKIKVRWQNEDMKIRLQTFTGWTAQIIQHEVDHCQGILI